MCAQVRRAFDMDHATITALAAEEAAGCEGANFLPFLTGERTPNWPHSTGCITGLRAGSMRPGLLYRAALEGATFSLLNGAALPSVIGPPLPLALRSTRCPCLVRHKQCALVRGAEAKRLPQHSVAAHAVGGPILFTMVKVCSKSTIWTWGRA
jgi:hypothetical protein